MDAQELKILVLENTVRGFEDVNNSLKKRLPNPVLVFTEIQKMLNEASDNGDTYIFIIDLLTPGVEEQFLRKLSEGYPNCKIIGLLNSSNEETARTDYSGIFHSTLIKNPSMVDQLVADIEKINAKLVDYRRA